MATSIVLFNRDLRVHDHPALAASVRWSDRVIPLFVLDRRITKGRRASPNRVQLLLDALRDLRTSLRDLGGDLIVRHGDPVAEAVRLARDTGASTVRTSEDVSPFARQRESELREACAANRLELMLTPGITVVPPGERLTQAGTSYRVFTPYWRSWEATPRRAVEAIPHRVRLPDQLDAGAIPELEQLLLGARSPRLPMGGETPARAQLLALLERPPAAAGDGSDHIEDSSQLGMALHFGCLSPLELETALQGQPGDEELRRSLCWRDFFHQLTAHHPGVTTRDFRSRRVEWRRDADLERAWQEGNTGYPFVDAAMRQLCEEGWMPNRLRMLVASVLTKHLGIDWRVGAAHFHRWLVDGDVANNTANWQWVAGTGSDTRPNRILNPVRQAKRFDPRGEYVRRYVPELAPLTDGQIHEPWRLGADQLHQLRYPERIFDHEAAAATFLDRGRTPQPRG